MESNGYAVYTKSYVIAGHPGIAEVKIEAGKEYHLIHDDIGDILKRAGVTLGQHMYETEWREVGRMELVDALNLYIRGQFKLVAIMGYD